MEDILKSIKAFLYDRASSPLFGAFIISWIAWNYRFIVILLSDEKHISKFKDIDTYINSYTVVIPWTEITIGFYVGSGIVFPLLTALSYIYLYPYVAEPIYSFHLKKQKNITRLKKEANDSRIIDENDARELFKKLADMQSKYDTDIGTYQKQVDSLRITIDELSKNNPQDFSKFSDQELQDIIDSEKIKNKTPESASTLNTDELNEEQLYILKIISDNGGFMKDDDIIDSSSYDRVKTEFHLEDLDNKGYLSRDYNQRVSAYATGLTTKSKKIMVEKGYAK